MNKLLRHDTEQNEKQCSGEFSNIADNMSIFDNKFLNYLRSLLKLFSSPQLLCCINKTFIMDLIDRSRTGARGMETNYVVVTGRFNAIDLYHNSPLT